MKLRQIALSIAAASALAAAAPAFAQSAVSVVNPDGSTTTYVSPPAAVVITPDANDTLSSQPAIVSPGYTYNAQQGVVNGYIVTEPGGMNPQERAAATPGTVDHATGQITAPGYMGPRDSRGQ